jgi:peroxiredoxin (alkyl hydroperoxide reductase subunit C)
MVDLMLSLIGQKAPHFKANAVFGNTFREISLEDYKGKYVVLFFYPLDFTFVCPTELHAFQENYAAFKALGAEVLACSIDSQFCHLAWLDTPKEQGGIQGIEYGLIADLGGKIAEQFGVLSTGGVAYRGLFLMDKEGIIRHMLVNDLPLGRSVPEAVRTLEALQHVETAGEVCPANWTKGSQAINTNKDSVGNYLGKRFA